MTEATIYGWVRAAVRELDPTGVAWKIQDAFTTGLPDQLLCVRGRVAWLESKWLPKLRPSRLGHTASQYARIREWARAGGTAGLLVGWEEHLFWIDADHVPRPDKIVIAYDIIAQSRYLGAVMVDENSRAGCARIVRTVMRE